MCFYTNFIQFLAIFMVQHQKSSDFDDELEGFRIRHHKSPASLWQILGIWSKKYGQAKISRERNLRSNFLFLDKQSAYSLFQMKNKLWVPTQS